jgi:hypothetical protein
MRSMNSEQYPSTAVARRLVDRIVALADAGRDDRVLVIGWSCVDFVLELARRGFQDVACCVLDGAPHAGVPGVHGERGLHTVLSYLGRGLCPRGALVIATDEESSEWLDRRRAILVRRGFVFFRSQLEPDGGFVICRRTEQPHTAQAA